MQIKRYKMSGILKGIIIIHLMALFIATRPNINLQMGLIRQNTPREEFNADVVQGRRQLGKIVGFYNIYSGHDPALTEGIVREQAAALESANITGLVDSITCVVFGQMHSNFPIPQGRVYVRSNTSSETGDERNTLDLLYWHCHDHPADSVFYIHTKGSFHPSEANFELRRNLMKSVLYCIHNQTIDDSDICGFRFAPIPYPHLSGNMWYARCEYISKLISPMEFDAQLHNVQFKDGCADWTRGVGRAAQEHWVTSHPSMIVKDLLPYHTVDDAPIRYFWSADDVPDPASWEPDPQRFPRPGMTAGSFVRADYWPNIECSTLSHKDQQYVAVYGHNETKDAVVGGFRDTWPKVAIAAFEALGDSQQTHAFLRDAHQHFATLSNSGKVTVMTPVNLQSEKLNYMPGHSCGASSLSVTEFRDLGLGLNPVTDKITYGIHPEGHSYYKMYGIFLGPLRYTHVKMLEIGIGCKMYYGPGASVQLWRSYFSNLELWGADYDTTCVENAKSQGLLNGIHVLTGNQGDPETVQQWVLETSGSFDVIIDDGSHQNRDIKTSFDILWPTIKPGGFYFIEDLQVGRFTPGDAIADVIECWIDQLVIQQGSSRTTHPLPDHVDFIMCQSEACVIAKSR